MRDYVFSHEEARQLYRKIEDLLEFTIPLYEKEGKRQLVVAFGCTGGTHRSVSFAWRAAQALKAREENVFVSHRASARREQRQEEWKRHVLCKCAEAAAAAPSL